MFDLFFFPLQFNFIVKILNTKAKNNIFFFGLATYGLSHLFFLQFMLEDIITLFTWTIGYSSILTYFSLRNKLFSESPNSWEHALALMSANFEI